MNTALYRRVSTDHQDGSLEVQEKRVLDYVAYKGLQTSEGVTFSDPDTSGSIPMLERPGGRALLNRIRLGDLQHLVVAKLDRLGRNTRDFLQTIETLDQLGVTLHIADFGGDSMSTQGHWGKMILTILAAVAEGELGEIRDRTQKRMDHKFNRGELTGNVPFGFDCLYTFADGSTHLSDRALSLGSKDKAAEPLAIDLMQAHGQVISKVLVDNTAEQDVIRLMHKLRTQQHPRQSFKMIAALLNAQGYRTKQGGEWQCGNVASILQSRHTQKVLATGADALAA